MCRSPATTSRAGSRSRWSPAALAKARDYAQRVTDDLGGTGIFGVELFVKGDRSGSPKSARGRTTPAW